jgi:hypothetical protein
LLEWHWVTILGVVFLFLGLWGIWKYDVNAPGPSLKLRMDDFAKKAVRIAKQEHECILDFSRNSIDHVDPILDELHRYHLENPIAESDCLDLGSLRWLCSPKGTPRWRMVKRQHFRWEEHLPYSMARSRGCSGYMVP